MIIEFFNKILNKINKRRNSLFSYSVDKQNKYIKHFQCPKDNYERSYFQYCCQMKLMGEPLHILFNIIAFPATLLFILRYKCVRKEEKQKVDAVFFRDGKPFNILPTSLEERYAKIEENPDYSGSLRHEDIVFLIGIIKKYPFSWLFLLKIVVKLAQYSNAITRYDPKAIISCGEYSYTSSLLTEYCHTRDVRLINVMHGEKLYHMRDSFVKYDEFYVWNQCYVDLFVSLGADIDQFHIEVPKSLVIPSNGRIEKKYNFTYYLASETEDVLRVIAENMSNLIRLGNKVSIRPHPRYSDINIIKELFLGMNIEDTSELTIEESLLQTNAAISLFSTVLNQAYHSGISIVIDDVSNPEYFKKLVELQYGMLQVDHKLLSEKLSNASKNF